MAISRDQRTLYSLDFPGQHMARQVNGANTVRLYINDVLVPASHPLLGWSLEPDNLRQEHQRWYKIKFNRVQNVSNWVIEVGYATTAAYCRKCAGTNLVADYRLGSDGSWKKTTKQRKLIQRCMKVILTSYCPFYPSLVCALRDRIGKKGGQVFSSDDAAYEVNSVLGKLKSIQQAQGRYQSLDPQEMLQGVSQVHAATDTSDPRVMSVSMKIQPLAGDFEPLAFGLLKS